jgi:hypothetical protein
LLLLLLPQQLRSFFQSGSSFAAEALFVLCDTACVCLAWGLWFEFLNTNHHQLSPQAFFNAA